MRLTKFAHSCVRLDEDSRALVVDPGSFLDAGQIADVFKARMLCSSLTSTATTSMSKRCEPPRPRTRSCMSGRRQVSPTQFADLGDRVHTVRED